MRNEALNAYSLHQRPFKDKQAIYYLLTLEHGIVHGIAKKGIPQFVPLNLFANGKKPLKTFQQVNIAHSYERLVGQQQYAALYINEITLKLLPVEDSVPSIYAHYSEVVTQLQHKLDNNSLRLALRFYEHTLFNELGVAVDLDQDSGQNPIDPDLGYRFSANSGWMPVNDEDTYQDMRTSKTVKKTPNFMQLEPMTGHDIIEMRTGIHFQTLKNWSIIHREIVDHLFEYQPLQSRILWQQYHRYQ